MNDGRGAERNLAALGTARRDCAGVVHLARRLQRDGAAGARRIGCRDAAGVDDGAACAGCRQQHAAAAGGCSGCPTIAAAIAGERIDIATGRLEGCSCGGNGAGIGYIARTAGDLHTGIVAGALQNDLIAGSQTRHAARGDAAVIGHALPDKHRICAGLDRAEIGDACLTDTA